MYDKQEVKDALTLDNYYDLLTEFQAEPQYAPFGLIARTVCHNNPIEEAGSYKLYLYKNSSLFHCYTGCPGDASFDIFQLVIKVAAIQHGIDYDLNDAVRYVAQFCGIQTSFQPIEEEKNADWEYIKELGRIQEIELTDYHAQLKEYDDTILTRFNYTAKITPWLNEGIAQDIIEEAKIGYYPGGEQITIPHYDCANRLIGVRGRALCQEEAELYGKYRPVRVGKTIYSHPLGFNLYNLNHSKDQIASIQKAVLFESEKSALLYRSYFGDENDISVACCGSNLSIYQVQLLLDAGAKEIVVALDRQFQEINDNEFKRLTSNLSKMNSKYKNSILLSFIFDKNKITSYKASPIDEGPEKFLQLYKERIYL